MSDELVRSDRGIDSGQDGPLWPSSDHRSGDTHNYSHHDNKQSASTNSHLKQSSFMSTSINSDYLPTVAGSTVFPADRDYHRQSVSAQSSLSSPTATESHFPSPTETGTTYRSQLFSLAGDENDNDMEAKNTDIVLQHGFSFGAPSISFEQATITSCSDEADGDEEMKEIYGTERNSSQFPLDDQIALWPVADVDELHMFSKRIEKVGNIGQHLGLGHQLGVLAEDSQLLPKNLKLSSLEYVVDEDSPVQIDITWRKAENEGQFKNFVYEVEMKPQSPDGQWNILASVKFPIFRVYHIEDKLILRKMQFLRQAYDSVFLLRIRGRGDVMLETGTSCTLTGGWSEEINLIFLGYETRLQQIETTEL